MTNEQRVKLIALYFPQFHAIPENDAWWGKGFTDWDNVRKARPLFPGHEQPRVPLGGRYYDQTVLETLRWQVGLARAHGVHGFCHYHYWFDGKQLLHRPTDLMLATKDLDFPFCLAWANETWSRRWEGRDHHVLQAQSHRPDPQLWNRHFDVLFRAWCDERAIRIDGKPVFLVYRAHLIREPGAMFDLWRERALRQGLPGLYLIAMKQYEFPNPDAVKPFDAVMDFQPFEALYSPRFEGAPAPIARRVLASLRRLPEPAQDFLRAIRNRFLAGITLYDYDMVWRHIVESRHGDAVTTFPGAFVDWDNSPRYVRRARIFRGASPERFAHWFGQLVEATARRPVSERLIFLNAWNEWAEGTYLEPDERHGYRYLEALRDAMAAQPGARLCAD